MSEQRNVFVTGAASGIGAATVRLLTERGHTVYAGVHSDRGSLAGTAGVRMVTIDVRDPDSVAAAAEQVSQGVGRQGLHAVVNSAGVIVQGPLELVPPDELQRQFEINTFGPAYVIQAFLPLLRAGRGRVVNLSAPTGRLPLPFMGALSGSKAALESMSDALRTELAVWDIPVAVVVPGGTATDIFSKADAAASAAMAETKPELLELYQKQLAAVAKASDSMKPGPVDAVAKVVVSAVTDRTPKRRYLVGPGVRSFGFLSHLPHGLRDRLVSGAMGLRKING